MTRGRERHPGLGHLLERLGREAGPGGAVAWMLRRVPSLGGERPVDLVRAGRMDEVRAVVARLEGGASS